VTSLGEAAFVVIDKATGLFALEALASVLLCKEPTAPTSKTTIQNRPFEDTRIRRRNPRSLCSSLPQTVVILAFKQAVIVTDRLVRLTLNAIALKARFLTFPKFAISLTLPC